MESKKSLKELTAVEVAEIIYQAIEDQPWLNRTIIIPTITALIRVFAKVNNVYVVEKNEESRKFAANKANFKCIYWQRKAKELDPENIQKWYDEINALEKEAGY